MYKKRIIHSCASHINGNKGNKMQTKKQALEFAKLNNIKVTQFKNNDQQGYVAGNVKVLYCGYGNMFKIENSQFGLHLGDCLIQAIKLQIN
jgi:hypothetical protein